jgi:hypothetical protein
MISPLASPFRGGWRNLTPMRARGRGGVPWSPANLVPLAWYDPNNGGSSTQITDSSGNGLDAFTFAASTASPTYLAYSGTPFVWVPGVNGNVVTGVTTAWSPLQDAEYIAEITPAAWVPAANQTIFAQWTGTLQHTFDLRTTGIFRHSWVDNTPTTRNFDSSAHSLTGSSKRWVRSRIDANNGASGTNITFGLSSDGSAFTDLNTATVSSTGVARSGTSVLAFGGQTTSAQAMGGYLWSLSARNATSSGTEVALFRASDCAQSGFTDSYGNAWTVNRSAAGGKTVVLGTQAGLARSIVQFATDDYGTVPAAAIPAMTASDAWSVVLVIRQWDTATSFGRYLSTKLSSGTGKGIAIRTNGTGRQIACHFGDGTNTVDSFGPGAAAAGVKQVVVVSCTGPLVTIYVNGTPGTPVDVSSIGDRTTGQMQVGRDAGSSSSYQDFDLIAFGTVSRALSAGEASQLSTYFGGGS